MISSLQFLREGCCLLLWLEVRAKGTMYCKNLRANVDKTMVENRIEYRKKE